MLRVFERTRNSVKERCEMASGDTNVWSRSKWDTRLFKLRSKHLSIDGFQQTEADGPVHLGRQAHDPFGQRLMLQHAESP